MGWSWQAKFGSKQPTLLAVFFSPLLNKHCMRHKLVSWWPSIPVGPLKCRMCWLALILCESTVGRSCWQKFSGYFTVRAAPTLLHLITTRISKWHPVPFPFWIIQNNFSKFEDILDTCLCTPILPVWLIKHKSPHMYNLSFVLAFILNSYGLQVISVHFHMGISS